MTRAPRTLLAVASGTLVLFVWGALSHLVIIRGVGFAALPAEHALERGVDAVGARPVSGWAAEPGLYAFPAPPDWRGEPTTEASTAAWEARFRQGPSGLLVVRPRGEGAFSPQKLLVQLAADLVAVVLALFLVTSIPGSFARRVACVASLGGVGLLSVGLILWNWYAFPDAFFAALCFDVLVGWLLVGSTLAAVWEGTRAAPAR